MVHPLETLIGTALGGGIGSTMMIGVVGFITIVIFGVALRLSIEAFLVILLPFTFLLAMHGGLPPAVLYGLIIACAFIIFIAIMRMIKK